MDMPHQMKTISEILEKLRVKRIDNAFQWTEKGLTLGKGKYYQPEDLEIVKVYRFEGITDPADMSILYIIEAKDDHLVGYRLDAYGAANQDHDIEYYNFIRLIPEKGHAEQALFEL